MLPATGALFNLDFGAGKSHRDVAMKTQTFAVPSPGFAHFWQNFPNRLAE
jgi:hypothetical protein